MKLIDTLRTSIQGSLITKSEFYDEGKNEVKKVTLWEPKNVPKAWAYLIRTEDVYSNLEETFNELVISLNEIKKMINNPNSESTYLKFMMKNWISRFVSLYEISLALINEILDLGYTGNTITKSNLERNRHISENQILDDLRVQLYKLIIREIKGSPKKPIVSLNNKVKHQGELKNDIILDNSRNELFNKWRLYKDFADYQIDYEKNVTQIYNDLTSLTNDVCFILNELLVYLDTIFSEKFSKMKNKSM